MRVETTKPWVSKDHLCSTESSDVKAFGDNFISLGDDKVGEVCDFPSLIVGSINISESNGVVKFLGSYFEPFYFFMANEIFHGTTINKC